MERILFGGLKKQTFALEELVNQSRFIFMYGPLGLLKKKKKNCFIASGDKTSFLVFSIVLFKIIQGTIITEAVGKQACNLY